MWFGAIMVLGSILIVCGQIALWLWGGEWHTLTVMDFLFLVGAEDDGRFGEWIRGPENWVGLHKLFDSLPLSAVIFLFGLLIIREASQMRFPPADNA